MGYRPAKPEDQIWDKFLEFVAQFEVDVALLNEVSTAVLARQPDHVLYESWVRGDSTASCGSGAPRSGPVSRFTEIRHARARSVDDRRPNVRFANSRPGSWTAGIVELEEGKRLTCVSLYGLMDELSDASVHRSLSDLSPLFSDPRYKEHLVMGAT